MKNAGHVLLTMYYYYLLLLQDAKPLGKCPPWFESNKVHLHREPRAQPACGSGFNRTLRSGILSAGWRNDLVGLGRPSLQGCRQGELTELLNPHTNASRQLALVPSP